MHPYQPLAALALAAMVSACAPGTPTCLLPTQKPMILIDVYFGRDVPGRAPVSDAEWAAFARTQITPRFPDGFTVIDAHGQWLNTGTAIIGAEATKMVRIAVPASANLSARVDAITSAYRAQFKQLAVGVTSQDACGAF